MLKMPWKKPKPQNSNWITVIHNGYKVIQRELKGSDAFGRKYERTYYRGAYEVLHEVGDYMTEHELMIVCDEMDDLLEVLYREIGGGLN